MKKHYLILLFAFITLLLFVSCNKTDQNSNKTSDTGTQADNNGTSDTGTQADNNGTYYHPELGKVPTMEDLGLRDDMSYDEIVEKLGEPNGDVGSGAIIFEWNLDDEKKLFVWFYQHEKILYANGFKIGTKFSDSNKVPIG